MSKDPYFTTFINDELADMADLSGDEIGALHVVKVLCHAKSGPIDDDPRWIARRAGLTTRRWGAIRAKLIGLDLLECRHGMIASPSALRRIAKRLSISEERRNAALARWHAGQGDLDLEGQSEIKSEKKGRKPQNSAKTADANASIPARAHARSPLESQSGEKLGKNSEKKAESRVTKLEPKPAGILESGDANASGLARARDSHSQSYKKDSTNESESYDPRDAGEVLERISRASGFWPSPNGQRDKALEFVQAWLKIGISIEGTAVPVIERMIAHAPDKTTGSLARFDRQIRAEHAASIAEAKAAKPAGGNGWSPGTDDPDERLAQIRAQLRALVGPRPYDAWLKPMHLGIDNSELIATLPSPFMADWVLTNLGDRIGRIAKPHGFTKVIISAHPP